MGCPKKLVAVELSRVIEAPGHLNIGLAKNLTTEARRPREIE
jgi:hypothetical protein